MRPSVFVPARDSRHRHACLALCRALVREGRRIPLPKDAVLLDKPAANPIQYFVIAQFRKNKGDVSPRLVFAALTAGYKFLSLFKQAQDPASQSHADVLAHIRTRQSKRAARIASRQTPPHTQQPPQRTSSQKPNHPPMLSKKVAPDGTISYESNYLPRPSSAIREGSRRRIPRLFVTSVGVPFLRFSKPQPTRLGGMIRQVGDRVLKTQEMFRSMSEEALPDAREEDRWEDIVRRQAESEGTRGALRALGEDRRARANHQGSTREGLREAALRLKKLREYGVARAQAMARIVEEEKRMLREEVVQARNKRRRERELTRQGPGGAGVEENAPRTESAPTDKVQ